MTPDAQPRESLADGPFFVVLNTRSGSSGADDVTSALENGLAGAKRHHELFPVGEGDDLQTVAKRAAERARRERGVLVVAGGDGTIRCVATQALAARCPLGILPRGTFNITSRTYGIPLELDAAVDALLRAKPRPVQVGTVNGRVFLVNASLGLYPELLEEREQYKRQFGRRRSVAFLAALVTLLRDHRHLSLHSEHEQGHELVEASTLFVGNNPMQLAQVGLPEAEDVQHRKLAAVFVKPVGKLERLGLFARGLRGKMAGAQALHDFAFEQLTVQPARSKKRTLKLALDGEIVRMAPPLHFALAPEPLQLLTPTQEIKLDA